MDAERSEGLVSLETWKAEFYPKAAADTTPEEALAHSIRKWEGLRADALARHGVTQRGSWLCGEELELSFIVACSSCALCYHYMAEPLDDDGDETDEADVISRVSDACEGCPLYEARGGVACDVMDDVDDRRDPYNAYASHGDPVPMLRWLRKAAEAAS